jgi:hypothetical protein
MGAAQTSGTLYDVHGNLLLLSLGDELVTAIGYGIGAVATHETGHQLFLPHMDCGIGGYEDSCPGNNYIYQYGAVGGKNADWTFRTISGMHLKWSLDARCTVEKRLLGTSQGDPQCR